MADSAGRGASPFVGRASEVAVLRARIDSAAAGAGGLVLVAGPAGIGVADARPGG